MRQLTTLMFAGWMLAGISLAQPAAVSETSETAQTLRWKFTAGEKLDVVMTQKIEQANSIQGNDIKSTNNTKTWMTWEVLEIDNEGNASVASTIDRITMSLQVPGAGEVTIDTDEEGDGEGLAAQLGGILRPMVGVIFSQQMTPRGKVFDVEIPAEALAGINNSPMARMGISADMLKDMSKNASPEFPVEPLQKGDQWTNSTQTDSPAGTIKLDTKYTYEGPEQGSDSLQRLAVELTMEFVAGTNPGGAEITVSEQDNQGDIVFDTAAGRIKSSQIDQDMTMQISVAGQQMTQKMKQSMTAEFSDK